MLVRAAGRRRSSWFRADDEGRLWDGGSVSDTSGHGPTTGGTPDARSKLTLATPGDATRLAFSRVPRLPSLHLGLYYDMGWVTF